MRWDDLFDDLESQLESELGAEEVDLRAEEERLRVSRLGIRDRLYSLHTVAAGTEARSLRLILRSGLRVTVIPTTFGRDWFTGELLDETGRRPACVVPFDAIEGVSLTRRQVEPSLEGERHPESPAALSGRLGLAFVLRDLCRRRRPVEVTIAANGSSQRLHGTIDRVGRDHLDLAVHEPGRPRREAAVTEYRMLRIETILIVRM